MMGLVLAACVVPGSSLVLADPVTVRLELSDGREFESTGDLSLVALDAGLGPEPCLASVQLAKGDFEQAAPTLLAFPSWAAGSAIRSRPGEQPDRVSDDGGMWVRAEDNLYEWFIGTVEITVATDGYAELQLTDGQLCTWTADVESCVAGGGTMFIDGPVLPDPRRPFSTSAGEWESVDTAEPYCVVEDWVDPARPDG